MSWEATAYVAGLMQCEDGAPLSRGQKFLLLLLSNRHNHDIAEAWPSLPTLAREALTSLSTLKRDIDYLEQHCTIERRYPEKAGRGHTCSYVFLGLDEPERLKQLLAARTKGVQIEPLFSRRPSGSETAQERVRNNSKGVQNSDHNKEVEPEPETKQNHHACGALSSWLAIKKELQQALPAREWKLWCRPAYLLKVLGGNRGDPGGHLLVSLPPSNAIMRAAQARLAMLRGLAFARGFGLSLTRYPDDHERERLRTEWPEFYAQMFGVHDADSEAST